MTCRRVCSRYAITLDKCLTRYVSCNRFDSTMSKLFETGRINRRFHTLTASIRDSGSTYRLIVFWIPVEQPTCKFPSHEKLYEIDLLFLALHRFFISCDPIYRYRFLIVNFIRSVVLHRRRGGKKLAPVPSTATIRLSRQ